MQRATLVPALCLSLLAGSATTALAQQEEPSRARLFVNGAFGVSSLSFSEARSYTLFAEESTLNADYQAKSGFGFEAGLQYRFLRHFGAAVSFAAAKRDETVNVSTGLPHPFYFDRPRQVSGSADTLSYKETAIHFDLVYAGRSGSLEFAVFAGASRIKVETDVVERIEFSHDYPFDSATLTGLPATTVEDSPFGFNVGGSLDYVLNKNFGLGAQVRFSRATAKLVPAQGASLDIDAGGFQVAAGLRIFF
jgi:opacity protein-like surface antigen